MKVYTQLDNLPTFTNPVITVGSFDGVHLGHRQILNYLKKSAAELKGESIVITFDPHPQQVLYPGNDFFLINTLEEKKQLLAQEQIEHLIILPFTRQFASQSFTEFLHLLIDKINPKAIVMGPNHNFGKNREGNSETMQEICLKNGIEIIIIPEFILNTVKVHSSKIRQYIINQEFTKAEKLLGYPLKKK